VSRHAAADAIGAFARVARSRRLGWYVFGAQAVLVHGEPRFTADVDITVAVELADLPGLVDDLHAAGFALRAGFAAEDIAQLRVVPLVHEGSELPVDIVVAGPGLEEEFLHRAVRRRIAGILVPFISAEDLVATKILAGRAKDLEDARGVVRQQRGRLDLAGIRTVLSLLEGALGQSDLVPALDHILADAGEDAGAPAATGRRRRGK
jgi:predicted nucleotidyltransferase